MKHKEIILIGVRNKNIFYYNMSDLITVIGNSCFKDSNIEGIKLSKNLKVIEDCGFIRCSRLREIDFTGYNNLGRLNLGSFCDCINLKEIYIPDGIELDRSVFWGCHNLVKVRLPNDLRTLRSSTFVNCKKLISIDIPSSVVEISKFTFHGTGIKEINISRNVKFSEKGHESIKVNYID